MDTTQTTSPTTDRPDAARSRRRHRSLFAIALTAAALIITACGAEAGPQADPAPARTPSTSTTAVARPTDAFDRLVGPAGAQVHVRCTGTGPATVVLISGFGGDSTAWASVEPAISSDTRVCSYDRPGTGTSEPPASTSTFASQAADLHHLLAEVGEPGPYVVVGHSFGGPMAVTFASQFADEVSGLVLVDASPADWPSALCAVTDDGSQGATMLLGMCADTFSAAGNPEQLDVRSAFGEVAEITTLGSLPTAVITAVERTLPADLAAPERVRLTDRWDRGQQAWAGLSSSSHVVTVDRTSHDIQLDQPQIVIDQITQLLP